MRTDHLATGLALFALLLAACGSDSSASADPNIVLSTKLEGAQITTGVIQEVDASLAGQSSSVADLLALSGMAGLSKETSFYVKALEWAVLNAIPYDVVGTSYVYSSRVVVDDQVLARRLTGAVFVPDPRRKRSAPIVLFTHGTELKAKLVASRGVTRSGYDRKLGGIDGLIAAGGAALGGFIVVAPDAPGMGRDRKAMGGDDDVATSSHPCCVRNGLACAGLDMVQAVIGSIHGGKLLPSNLTWNGKVYVVDYSEAGGAAMAVARDWQKTGGTAAGCFNLACAQLTHVQGAAPAFVGAFYLLSDANKSPCPEEGPREVALTF